MGAAKANWASPAKVPSPTPKARQRPRALSTVPGRPAASSSVTSRVAATESPAVAAVINNW